MSEFYEFREEHIDVFARAVGGRVIHKGSEAVFKVCPYCRSEKDKQTFSINVRTGQFQCKRASCGVKGNMITLAQDFNLDLGQGVSAYYDINNYNSRYKSYGYFAEREIDARSIEYMKSRGISAEITRKYQICYTTKYNKPVFAFPFLDCNCNLICTKYRWEVKPEGKGKEFWEANNKPYLFGVYQCEDFSTVVITEGQIDAMSLAEAGIKNPVSVPGGCNNFTWVPYCWDWLNKFEEIVVFGDCEKGKITLVEKIVERFSRSQIKVVKIADYKGCKDANELLQKYGKNAVAHAVENAQEILTDGITKAEKVNRVNIRDIPAFSTGVKELNRAMEGGLRKGDLMIVTGKRGDGKSTFVSQMACFMLNNAESKIFMYSGELVDSQVMEWLNSQLAGCKDYTENTLSQMREWYSNRLYLYDNNKISNDENEVFNRCITAIQKYGCNIIVLDNLMTAMRSTGNDIYQAQSRFANECAKLAKAYNVAVILIAHPNKGGIKGDNDSISGSGDITNNATYVLWYQRSDRISDQNIREVKLSKNRTNGELLNEVMLQYDKNSRRIFDEDAKDMKFGWQFSKGEENFIDATESMEIPF